MEFNDLIIILKKKLDKNFKIEKLDIEDKTFLHKKHESFVQSKFHIKLTIYSKELNSIKSVDANRRIFNVLKEEMKKDIHSLQIKII